MSTLPVTHRRSPLHAECGGLVIATSIEAALAVLATLGVKRCLLADDLTPGERGAMEQALRGAGVAAVTGTPARLERLGAY